MKRGRETQCSPRRLFFTIIRRLRRRARGHLFDGTEIDEILTLRIMTLTDEEKAEVGQGDERAREILERTECMPPEQLMKMHGAMRGLRRADEETP